jgi:signal transduction histidine kinase
MVKTRQGLTRRRRRIPFLGDAVSLSGSLALTIAVLALVPPVILMLSVLLPVAATPYAINPDGLARLAWWLLLVLGASIGAGYLISRLLLQPLTRLRDEVVNLARSGQRLAEMSLSDVGPLPTEVETLRSAFSSLLDALRLEQQKRSAFMATLVHDLKTPVIAGNHVLDAIRDDRLSREERLHLIESLRFENEALLELVQKMVDAHRFERGEVSLELEPTDLGALVRALQARFGSVARDQHLELHVSGEGHALASRLELERALSNLLENSLRYAHAVIRVEVTGNTITIADDGPGLSAPLESLTRPFHSQTLELAGREYTAGTGGLGLYIARQIVLAHGGQLEHVVRAETPTGTVLRITLRAV